MSEMDRAAPKNNRRRKTGPLKPITVERSALYYLQRFAASEAGLRAVL